MMEANRYYRAREMGGGNIMLYDDFGTAKECLARCVTRKEELQTSVEFFAVVRVDDVAVAHSVEAPHA